MRAILNEDMIVALTIQKEGTEIGTAPKGVGLERLRFDGEKVVDLATLDQIYVRLSNGVYSLHVVEVPGSQKVTMTYKDRKNLKVDAGVIRVKTTEELADEAAAKSTQQLKTKITQCIDLADLINLVDALSEIAEYGTSEATESVVNGYNANNTKLKSLLSDLRK